MRMHVQNVIMREGYNYGKIQVNKNVNEEKKYLFLFIIVQSSRVNCLG